MRIIKYKIVPLAIIILCLCSIEAASQAEIRHFFLLASAGDVRLYDKGKDAFNNLVKAGDEAVPYLITQLGRKNIRKVITAERALTEIGDDAVSNLIEALADTNKRIASISASILGNIGNRDALPSLMVAAQHGYSGLRGSACSALGDFRDTVAVTVLINALGDSIPGVRRAAALALGIIGTRRAIEPLFALLADTVYSVRYTAEGALTKIKHPKVRLIALASVDSAESPEKYHLIVVLGSTKSLEALDALEKYLQDADYHIRGFACEALGYFRGNWKVANMLKRTLWDNSEFVKIQAEKALNRFRKQKV